MRKPKHQISSVVRRAIRITGVSLVFSCLGFCVLALGFADLEADEATDGDVVAEFFADAGDVIFD